MHWEQYCLECKGLGTGAKVCEPIRPPTTRLIGSNGQWLAVGLQVG